MNFLLVFFFKVISSKYFSNFNDFQKTPGNKKTLSLAGFLIYNSYTGRRKIILQLKLKNVMAKAKAETKADDLSVRAVSHGPDARIVTV